MRELWVKIRSFITMNPIVLGTIILFVLMVSGAGLLWWGKISYVHPGPARAAVGLAVVILIVGLVINDLKAQNREQRAPGRLPRIIGLELLVKRWREFQPKEPDSVILYEQFSIAMSIAQLAYKEAREIRIIKYFSGFKITGGAFLLQPGQDRPLVLKFDSWEDIEKENDRYKDCVAKRLGFTPGEPWIPPQRRGFIGGEEWGAITYNLIPAGRAKLRQLQTFAEYYQSHDNPQQIATVLNEIFEALGPWWTNPIWPDSCAQWRRNTLYGEYDRLTRKRNQMEEGIAQAGKVLQIGALQDITADHSHVDLGNDLVLHSPLNWVRDVFGGRQLPDWVCREGLRRDSIVHGDFHTGNILISENEQLRAWVIDFPHTHVGPTIQDIARLEADLKFGLLADETLQGLGPNGLCNFEANLLPAPRQRIPSFADLRPVQLPADQQTNPQLRKAREAVCLLRKEALKYMIGNDGRPYYLALLHATLPTLYYRDRRPFQKLYAFIAAALLCERLSS